MSEEDSLTIYQSQRTQRHPVEEQISYLYHYHYPGKVLNFSQQLVTQEIRAETARMSPDLTSKGRESLAKGCI